MNKGGTAGVLVTHIVCLHQTGTQSSLDFSVKSDMNDGVLVLIAMSLFPEGHKPQGLRNPPLTHILMISLN